MTHTVDIFSDVICPWCFIGKRRLEKAIAALEGQHEVHVRWLPFQLNPSMPKDGISSEGVSHQEVWQLGAFAGTRRQELSLRGP